MQEKCSECGKVVRSGGVELFGVLMCGACVRESNAKRQAAQSKAQAPAKTGGRCAHYAAIREFMAVARELGMDASAKEACRAAVGMLLGRKIASRADLSGQEWAFATNALRMGRLFW